LDSLVNLLKNDLSDSLTGIYLHGSMAMGCFNPLQSDIDILVLVKEKMSIDIYKKIAKKLIALEDELKLNKGFELSAVLDSYAKDFVYPTPFEFHYSSRHKERYRLDDKYFCGDYTDKDLAAHFTVTYCRGVTLFGKPIKEAFNPVDKRYYIDSIKADIDAADLSDEASENITTNPVYYVLNMQRVLLYLKESVISSKNEAGVWALNNTPEEFKPLISQCLKQYAAGDRDFVFDHQTLSRYKDCIFEEIEKLL